MHLRPFAASAFAALLASAAPAAAQTLCSAPVAPICTELDSTFEDSGSTGRCREDLDDYSAELDAYADCVAVALDELRAERAALEAEYACRAAGGEACGDDAP